MIRRLLVKNFKSFRAVDVRFNNFNVLIGANASGKSNFINVFRFLHDISQHGLSNAVSLQGGVEYLRNIAVGASEPLVIEAAFDDRSPVHLFGRRERDIAVRTTGLRYMFALRFRKRGSRFEIASDQLIARVEAYRPGRADSSESTVVATGDLTVSSAKGRLTVHLDLPAELRINRENLMPGFYVGEKLDPSILIMQTPIFGFASFARASLLTISLFDFDPKLPKRAVPITGREELEEDGSNLAIVLNKLIKAPETRRKLSNLIKDALPFVEGLNVDRVADKSLLFKLRESFFKKHYLPASLISDGTINVTALVVALYFTSGRRLTIIEEPERNIHPHLMSRVVSMMKDSSRTRQLIVTTHNPVMVKASGIENLILISRDEDGFSTIARPAERQELKSFLSNQLGIEDLYVQDLLNIG